LWIKKVEVLAVEDLTLPTPSQTAQTSTSDFSEKQAFCRRRLPDKFAMHKKTKKMKVNLRSKSDH